MLYLKLIPLILFEPQFGFTLIKRHRSDTKPIVPILMFLLCLLVRIGSIYLTHYPLNDADLQQIDLVRVILELIVPLLSWVGGLYLVTTIRDGESTFFETFTAIGYSLIPYILLALPLALASRMMSGGESGLYNALYWAILLWCGILMIYSVSHLNSYTLPQTLFNCLLAILSVLFIWAVIILLYILVENVVSFVAEVINEYRLLGRSY